MRIPKSNSISKPHSEITNIVVGDNRDNGVSNEVSINKGDGAKMPGLQE